MLLLLVRNVLLPPMCPHPDVQYLYDFNAGEKRKVYLLDRVNEAVK